MSGALPWRAEEWRDRALADRARGCGGEVDAALALARDLTPMGHWLGAHSWDYLAGLATLGSVDLTTARAAEPHLDAVGIIDQAGADLSALGVDDESTFGVYAANAPGHGLTASSTAGGGVAISGTKAWCSLAGSVSHALVTAQTPAGVGLYAVPLRHPGVVAQEGIWCARGLTDITTSTLSVTDVPAMGVGGPGWYLERPGFSWGGIGVAAVWFGAAAALAGRLLDAAGRREPDQVALMHLGQVDILLHAALLALCDAAERIDAGDAQGADGARLALRVRAVAAQAAEETSRLVGHALGPAPLTMDEEHARRVADLAVYVRQHHAARDWAALGRAMLG